MTSLHTDLDLTDAVEAAARAYWEHRNPALAPWDDVVTANPALAHDIREQVLPAVTAAAPVIATAALARAALDEPATCDHGGTLTRRFDGGRGAMTCDLCDEIVGYWTPPVEGEQPGCTGAGDCPATAHTHGCHADTEGHCEHPEEHGWTPATVKPSVEDVARAILMVTQVADADPDYAWSVQYPEVQDELLDQARAVLALLPGRSEAEVYREGYDQGLRDAASVSRSEAEVRREAAEKALRDAADDPVAEEFLRALPPAEYGENAVETSAAWLRDRADRIEKEADRG